QGNDAVPGAPNAGDDPPAALSPPGAEPAAPAPVQEPPVASAVPAPPTGEPSTAPPGSGGPATDVPSISEPRSTLPIDTLSWLVPLAAAGVLLAGLILTSLKGRRQEISVQVLPEADGRVRAPNDVPSSARR